MADDNTTTTTSTTPRTDDDDHQSPQRTTNTHQSLPPWSLPHRSPVDRSTNIHDAPVTHHSPPSPSARRKSPATSPACGCTKIAIMQLFHEMKQVFATVPDYLVCQYVADNCHNRPALIEHLRREAARQPATVQAYPQALRNQCHPLAVSPPLSMFALDTTPAAADSIDDPAHRLQPIETTTSNHNHPASNPTTRPHAEVSSAMAMPSRPHRPPPSPPAPAERRRFGLLRSAAAAAEVPIKTRYPCFDPRPIDPDNVVQSHLGHHRAPPPSEPMGAALPAQPDRIGSSANAISPKPFAMQQTLDLSNNDKESPIVPSNPSTQSTPPLTSKPRVPDRPSTLSLPPATTTTPSQHLHGAPNHTDITPQLPQPSFTPPVLRTPTRRAPPRPPAVPTAHRSPACTASASAGHTPINVSVNVCVSQAMPPVAPARTVRHTTELSVTPVLSPVSPAVGLLAAHRRSPDDGGSTGDSNAGIPMRSFTSVQFKLRSPTAAPTMADSSFIQHRTTPTTAASISTPSTVAAAPIHISAGSSLLTYSSASYDARNGLHSNFQITVDGGGNGTITAMRTRPTYTRGGSQSHGASATAAAAVTTPTAAAGASALMSSGGNFPAWDEADIVHRQLLCKQRLCVELENDRQRLQRMQHEIQTLCSPIPADGASQLADDIERLQTSCKLMVQQVEEAGPYVLGETNEAVYHQVMSSQTIGRSPATHPPRPPATPSTPLRPAPSLTSPLQTAAPPAVSAAPSLSSSSYWSAPGPASSDTSSNAFALHQQRQQQLRQQQQQQQQQHQQQHHYQQYQHQAPPPPLPWACNMCTFQNHPLLNKCEQCEMPLITTSGTVPTQTRPRDSRAVSLLPASSQFHLAASRAQHPTLSPTITTTTAIQPPSQSRPLANNPLLASLLRAGPAPLQRSEHTDFAAAAAAAGGAARADRGDGVGPTSSSA